MDKGMLKRALVLVICLVVTAISPTAPVRAQVAPTFVVNSPADVAVISGPLDNGVCETVAGNGVCTLRAAIIKANHFPGAGVTILLPALPEGGVYRLTIPNGTGSAEAVGDLNITARMTIKGEGWNRTTIDAINNGTRIFFVNENDPIRIEGVTLRNGNEPISLGGAVQSSHSNLTLDGVRINFSTARSGGAVFSVSGKLEIHNSRIEFNNAMSGAGIFAMDGSISVSNSEIVNNTAREEGGGIFLSGIALDSTIDSSLIQGNTTATNGGGLVFTSGGKLAIVNSSIIGNKAVNNGGGVYYAPITSFIELHLFNVTVANNEANLAGQNFLGGGIFSDNSHTLRVNNSIISGNTRPNNGATLLLPSDCAGAITSQGYNIITDAPAGECVVTGAFSPVNPKLALSTAQNGGPTATLALLPGSPAIDAGPPAGCTSWDGSILRKDQRGFPRPTEGCDLGAFEVAWQLFLPAVEN